MNRDDRLADLIDRWEELRREGKSPSATDLASESPELIGPLREWITAFDLADQMEARTATIGGRRWRLDAEHVSLVDLSNTILAHGLVTALDLDQSVADLERGKASPTANELSAALIGRGLLTAEQSLANRGAGPTPGAAAGADAYHAGQGPHVDAGFDAEGERDRRFGIVNRRGMQLRQELSAQI